jgi:hypothetical protein
LSETWKSQRFDAEGSTTAPGILKQLGRPSLDEFTILVREAAQNSWDARRGDGDVEFSIRVERVGDRASTWKDLLLPGPPERSVPDFEKAISSHAWCLVVSDRGTQGLGGPVRATERPLPGEKNDFVQFLRNVGEPRDSALGGGTYGFGKGIFYRTSSVRTILADSRVKLVNGYQRRVMGAALGNDFWDKTDTRYTGRHWWGRVNQGVVDPVVGFEAERIARALGLPPFQPHETGTNIVVLGVDLGLVSDTDETGFPDPQSLGVHLASAMLWNLWPKFRAIDANAPTAMHFSVTVDGELISIPSPLDVLSLRPFVEAYLALEDPRERRSYRKNAHPKIHTGDLAVRVGVAPSSETAVVRAARPFDDLPHHVVRMRQPGLVVDYLEGPGHPDPLFAYGGVFRATAAADDYFAASEPPTHDGWHPEGLDKAAKSVVTGAQRWIRDDLNQRFLIASSSGSGTSTTGLGQGSRRLSSLVAGVSATGADPTGPGTSGGGPGGGGSTGTGRAPIRLVGEPWIASHAGSLAVFIRANVRDLDVLTSVRARMDVVLDGGGREAHAPTGALTPQILGWASGNDSSVFHPGDLLTNFHGEEDWIIIAQFSDEVVTRFRLEVEANHLGA